MSVNEYNVTACQIIIPLYLPNIADKCWAYQNFMGFYSQLYEYFMAFYSLDGVAFRGFEPVPGGNAGGPQSGTVASFDF